MEGVPRMPMLSCPLRRSADTPSFKHKLKGFISNHYNESADSYSQEIGELDSLRSSATHVPKDLTGCSTLKKYFCQLNYLKSRFPMHEGSPVAVTFSWYDVYSETVHGWADIDFEMSCILYNIGALHTELGTLEGRQTPDGMKVACTHFQCAAWAFQHLRHNYPKFFTPDISPDMLSIVVNTCLGQAQECILEKSLIDNRKSTITAKVALQIVDYYQLALQTTDQMLKDSSQYSDKMVKTVKKWKKVIELKISYYASMGYLYRGLQSEDQQKWGERVTFYRAAKDKLEAAVKVAKGMDKTDPVFDTLHFTMDVIVGKLTVSEKDNEFIYHDKIPDLAAISSDIKGVSLVKGIPFKFDDPTIAGPDIFGRLVPIEAHEASSLYSEEKAKLLRTYSAKIEEKNEALDKFLIALQLDHLDLHSHDLKIPQELIDCCAALSVNQDAVKNLSDKMSTLSGKFHDVESNLGEILQFLKDEEANQKEYQKMIGKPGSSNILTELSREAQKYQNAQKLASDSNQSLHEAMKAHVANMNILMKPLDQVLSYIPSASDIEQKDEDAIYEMKRLAAKVDEMRKQRQSLENDLRNSIHSDDITKQLVVKKDQDLDTVFEDELKKHEKITQILDQNLLAQENIMRALTEANANYAETRIATVEVIRKRNAVIQSLLSSFEAYDELVMKCEKGIQFYTSLDENVTKLLHRVRSLCAVQSEEREQAMKLIKAPAIPSNAPYMPPTSYSPTNDPYPGMQALPNPIHLPAVGGSSKLKDYLSRRKTSPASQQPVTYSGTGASQLAAPTAVSGSAHQQPGAYSSQGQSYYNQPGLPASTGTGASQLAALSAVSGSARHQPGAYSSQGQSYYNQPGLPASTGTGASPLAAPTAVSGSAQQQPGAYSSQGQSCYNQPGLPASTGTGASPLAAPTAVSGSAQQQPGAYSSQGQSYYNQPGLPASTGTGASPLAAPTAVSGSAQQQPGAYSSQAQSYYNQPGLPASTFDSTCAGGIEKQKYLSMYENKFLPQLVYQHKGIGNQTGSQFGQQQMPTGHSYGTQQSLTSHAQQPATPHSTGQNQHIQSTNYASTTVPPTQQTYTPQGQTYFQQQPNVHYGNGTGSQFGQQQMSTGHSYGTQQSLTSHAQQPATPHSTGQNQHIQSTNYASTTVPPTQQTYTPQGQTYFQQQPNVHYGNGTGSQFGQQQMSTGHSYGTQQSLTSHAQQPATPHSTGQNQHIQSTNYASTTVPPTQQTYTPQGQTYFQQQPNVHYVNGTGSAPTANIPEQSSTAASKQSSSASSQAAVKAPSSKNIDLLGDIDLSSTQAMPLAPEICYSSAFVPESNGIPQKQQSEPNLPTVVNETSTVTPPTLGNPSSSETRIPQPQQSNVQTHFNISLLNGSNKKGKVDPYADPVLLSKFALEVEKLDQLIQSFDKKILSGSSNLDLKWRELLDIQNAASVKRSISVARCYPMKNRYADILPYDQSRVPLPNTVDDYINASFLQELSPLAIPYIATQAPLPSTYDDFWHMIWQYSIELIVCLVNDVDLKGLVYWPVEKGKDLEIGPFKIALQTCNPKSTFIERIFSFTQRDLKQTRVVIHLQFTQWGGNVFPVSPAPLLAFVNEVHSFQEQQRNLKRPVAVHCIAGTGKTGVFSVLSAALKEINAGNDIVDIIHVAGKACEQRKGLMIDKEYVRLAYRSLLYYCQDLLIKHGILTARTAFNESPNELNTRLDDYCSVGSGELTSSAESSRRSSFTSSPVRTISKQSKPYSNVPSNLTNIDPATFVMKSKQDPVNPKLNVRDAFESGKGALLDRKVDLDPLDPLSSLDPLWTIKK